MNAGYNKLTIKAGTYPKQDKDVPVIGYSTHVVVACDLPLLDGATLDRLRHNAYCLVLDGESYRAPKLIPPSGRERAEVRTWEALGDGVIDEDFGVRGDQEFTLAMRDDTPAARAALAASPHAEGRPTKKQRRALARLTGKRGPL